MQVLVQLANQKFGKNVDLKAYSLQQMINSNAAPATSQPQPTVNETVEHKPKTRAVAEQPVQQGTDELPSSQKTAPKQTAVPSQQSTADQPTTPTSDSAVPDDDDLVHDALFGGATKPVKKTRKPGQSFRDQL